MWLFVILNLNDSFETGVCLMSFWSVSWNIFSWLIWLRPKFEIHFFSSKYSYPLVCSRTRQGFCLSFLHFYFHFLPCWRQNKLNLGLHEISFSTGNLPSNTWSAFLPYLNSSCNSPVALATTQGMQHKVDLSLRFFSQRTSAFRFSLSMLAFLLELSTHIKVFKPSHRHFCRLMQYLFITNLYNRTQMEVVF